MAKKLWGGRFKKEIDKDFFEFQKSIQYDYRLARFDIIHSLLHVIALENAKILSRPESVKLSLVLQEILQEVREDKFHHSLDSEDIHTEIQNRAEKKVGKLAQKLHTLRSRNDQIAFDEKFYCFREARNIVKLFTDLFYSLISLKNSYKNISIVGYTHTQRAQNVIFSDYVDAFFYMFKRDADRLIEFSEKIVLCIGSGAFRGTSLTQEYDKAIEKIVRYLGKDEVRVKINTVENSLEHVSDRDFIIE